MLSSIPGTDIRLEAGWLSLSAKLTLCLLDPFFLNYSKEALIGVSDISRVTEWAVFKQVSVMRAETLAL